MRTRPCRGCSETGPASRLSRDGYCDDCEAIRSLNRLDTFAAVVHQVAAAHLDPEQVGRLDVEIAHIRHTEVKSS